MEYHAQIRLDDLTASEPEGTAATVPAIPVLTYALETLCHSGGIGRFGL
jgi:hypothetical protein